MGKAKYPLDQVLQVKRNRVEKAEKVVEEKKRALNIEEEKLKKVEEERNQVLNHHKDKLAQLRKAMDEGTNSEEILQMKSYLKIVKEKLAKEEIKVQKQKEVVKLAEKNLQIAKDDLHRKRIEEEKIKMHKEEWSKEMQKEERIQEEKDEDEMGTTIFEREKRKKRQ